jgi:hypothetical protein
MSQGADKLKHMKETGRTKFCHNVKLTHPVPYIQRKVSMWDAVVVKSVYETH